MLVFKISSTIYLKNGKNVTKGSAKRAPDFQSAPITPYVATTTTTRTGVDTGYFEGLPNKKKTVLDNHSSQGASPFADTQRSIGTGIGDQDYVTNTGSARGQNILPKAHGDQSP